jgi:hypothetical protein
MAEKGRRQYRVRKAAQRKKGYTEKDMLDVLYKE